jgi:diaminohydroxyphosphoribosylaminopyrimidine deaminase/5-amino-6-(5-phosphoribosylamino)uracil reductase
LSDDSHMRAAVEAARINLGLTSPNPVVGCVLVRDGKIVGKAATAAGGRPHAEDQALVQAGSLARGATAYVTLEPCGARSSGGVACADLLIAAGVVRVVVACEDPSPFASGRGSERLTAAGIVVETGLLSGWVLDSLDYRAWFRSQSLAMPQRTDRT